ncbi:efflux RND transporter permease subunit [Stenotrophobium rhamnosiphilum]|uniref:efflux RND transporter permease subunit n=1 Tax=Stenotrophobium rhamnosiphilum TaxID=2029166 RepID=UPI001F11882C|nr:efflux RND transporter permease subunit [Stenotrophobium rhamnosiphilum]
MTAGLLGQAVQIRPDADFEKTIPLDHPYMQVFRQYQAEFGGANTVLISLQQDKGDIYNEQFLTALKQATEEVTFVHGIDRAHTSSIFTRNVRFIEVVDGGFAAGDVVPANYSPTPEMFGLVRSNVGKAGLVGNLVSRDQSGALIATEVVENDPLTGKKTDLVQVAHDLEDRVRGRYASQTKYLYRLKAAAPPFEANEVVAESFSAPGWLHSFKHYAASKTLPDESQIQRDFSGRELKVEQVKNPDYNPAIAVHIIGFTKVIGDVSDASLQVMMFFALTVIGTMLALWWYLGSLRLALLPLGCSLVAVIWEFGLLHLFGYGIDPFAIMVPFLVLAVSTSHGVQYVNTWADQVIGGQNGFDASLATFRRLFIPGSIALLTNVAGFLTISLVPIGSIRDMSANACLGMLAVIVTNKIMMPVWLSYLGVTNVDAFRSKRIARINAGDKYWRFLSGVTEKPVAITLITLSLIVLSVSWFVQDRRIIGDAQLGVPELRPDSVYNKDVADIASNYSIGADILKIIAEDDAGNCVQYRTLEQIDQFIWHMRNTEGVTSARGFTSATRQAYQGMSEMNPKFGVVPRNSNVLVLVNRGIATNTGLLNFDCSAMPLFFFTANHKAGTIEHVIDTAKRLNQSNAEDFYKTYPDSNPAYCAEKKALRDGLGQRHVQQDHLTAKLRADGVSEDAIAADKRIVDGFAAIETDKAKLADQTKACPVNFAIGTGNVGVMAATNEVVESKELPVILWVYAVIIVLVLTSYRSFAALLVICIPLFMVSIFANALMAVLGIGLKVATLPVVALAVGIGVDYGIYIYDLLQDKVLREGKPLREAYTETLRQTGKAVIFTGICLAGGVFAWLFSGLQFQRDMGLLLVFMFTANMLGAVLLSPAYCRFLLRRKS